MRFVRKTDRKIKGVEAMSKYYVKFGNPNLEFCTCLALRLNRRCDIAYRLSYPIVFLPEFLLRR